MKSKKKAKPSKKSKSHAKSKSKTRRISRLKASPTSNIESMPTPTMTSTNISMKTCQEVEVGDIGGFGSTQELESHEKRCSETATEFCSHCGKNLCRNHFDLMHRDHDNTGHTTS